MKTTKRPKYLVTCREVIVQDTLSGTPISTPHELDFDVRSGSNKQDVRMIALGHLFLAGLHKHSTAEIEVTRLG